MHRQLDHAVRLDEPLLLAPLAHLPFFPDEPDAIGRHPSKARMHRLRAARAVLPKRDEQLVQLDHVLEKLRAHVVLGQLRKLRSPRERRRQRVRRRRPDCDAVAIVRPKEALPEKRWLPIRLRELQEPPIRHRRVLPRKRQSMNLSRRQIPRQHQEPEEVLVPISQLRRCRRPARRYPFFDLVFLSFSIIHSIHLPPTPLSFWKMSLLLHVALQKQIRCPAPPPPNSRNSPGRPNQPPYPISIRWERVVGSVDPAHPVARALLEGGAGGPVLGRLATEVRRAGCRVECTRGRRKRVGTRFGSPLGTRFGAESTVAPEARPGSSPQLLDQRGQQLK